MTKLPNYALKHPTFWLRIVRDMTSSAFSALLRNLTILALLFQVSFSGELTAANYTRPNDTKELFPLEKLPLPRHSMKELSMQLVTLALRPQKDTPRERRANAKLLALAMQLDPTNQTARKIDKALSQHPLSDFETESTIKSIQPQLLHYQKRLSTPEAGTTANQLAKYLSDATQILKLNQKAHPDSADWTGVVPPISAYTAPKKTTPKTKKSQIVDKKITPPKKPADLKPDITKAPPFHLTKISIKTPIKTEKHTKLIDPKSQKITYKKTIQFSSTPISVQFSPLPSSQPFEIQFSPWLPWLEIEADRLKFRHTLTQPIIEALQIRHPKLPAQKATIQVDFGQYSYVNQLAITAPIAVMLEASLQNKPLRSDLHICATINATGQLTQPREFWRLLNILRKNNSTGRLLVSPESAILLSQLLVYSELEFFTRWEIFTVKDLDQAIAAASQEETDPLNQSSQLFKTIQDLTEKTSHHQLTNNKAVRTRLNEILKLSPNHLSARILLLQGSNQRPRKLNETALAHELLPILQQLQQTLKPGLELDLPSYSTLKQTNQNLRDKFTPFEKHIDRHQDNLHKEILKILSDFRRLVTLSRRIESADSTAKIPLNHTATDLIHSMQNDCDTLLKKIDLAISPTITPSTPPKEN